MSAVTGRPCSGTEFRTRVQDDGRELHQCTTCGRVSRTKRRHRLADRNTASHDKTMGSLWEYAIIAEEAS